MSNHRSGGPLRRLAARDPAWARNAEGLHGARGAPGLLAACLAKHGEMKVRLDGHCDLRGSEGFNITPTWRTDFSWRYLISRGVHPERIEAQAFGEARLVCQEDTDSYHARNRPVEFVLKVLEARPQPAASLH